MGKLDMRTDTMCPYHNSYQKVWTRIARIASTGCVRTHPKILANFIFRSLWKIKKLFLYFRFKFHDLMQGYTEFGITRASFARATQNSFHGFLV